MKSDKKRQRVQDGADRKLKGVNPMTLKVDLESADPVHGSACRLTERGIWVKFTINRSKGSEDIERTQN